MATNDDRTSADLLTVDELAAMIGVRPHTLYQRRWRGDSMPRAIVIGNRLLFRRSDIEDWLQAHTEEPAS